MSMLHRYLQTMKRAITPLMFLGTRLLIYEEKSSALEVQQQHCLMVQRHVHYIIKMSCYA